MVSETGTDDWPDEPGPLAEFVLDNAAMDVEGLALEMLEKGPPEEVAFGRGADDGRPELSPTVDNMPEEAKLEDDEPGAIVLDDGSRPLVNGSDAEVFEDRDAEDEESKEPLEDAKIEEGKFVRG